MVSDCTVLCTNLCLTVPEPEVRALDFPAVGLRPLAPVDVELADCTCIQHFKL